MSHSSNKSFQESPGPHIPFELLLDIDNQNMILLLCSHNNRHHHSCNLYCYIHLDKFHPLFLDLKWLFPYKSNSDNLVLLYFLCNSHHHHNNNLYKCIKWWFLKQGIKILNSFFRGKSMHQMYYNKFLKSNNNLFKERF